MVDLDARWDDLDDETQTKTLRELLHGVTWSKNALNFEFYYLSDLMPSLGKEDRNSMGSSPR
jgi:hypothetical protein